MEDYVPLLQTGLWILFLVATILLLRPELATLRKALINRVEAGGFVKIGPVELGELRGEINAVRADVGELSERVSKLFLLAMSPPMYENLRKLSSGTFGNFEMSPALERELRHLRDLGYLEVDSVTRIPPAGLELLEHVSVTAAGARFVELRDGLG